jgi:hypothetical protein
MKKITRHHYISMTAIVAVQTKGKTMGTTLWGVREMSEALGLNQGTIRNWYRAGMIPAPFETPVGGPLWREEDIENIDPAIVAYAEIHKRVGKKK